MNWQKNVRGSSQPKIYIYLIFPSYFRMIVVKYARCSSQMLLEFNFAFLFWLINDIDWLIWLINDKLLVWRSLQCLKYWKQRTGERNIKLSSSKFISQPAVENSTTSTSCEICFGCDTPDNQLRSFIIYFWMYSTAYLPVKLYLMWW